MAENKETKDVIVISHPRSGTHLTIDAIINNFSRYRNNHDIEKLNLDHLMKKGETSLSWEELQANSGPDGTVYKTHTHGELERSFDFAPQIRSEILSLFDRAKKIYVYRDPRDVLVSLYFYNRGYDPEITKVNLPEYISHQNNYNRERYDGDYDRIGYWQMHVNSWVNKPDVLLISFEDFQNDYEGALQKVAAFIQEDLPRKIIDVRRKPVGKFKTFLNRLQRHPSFKKLFRKRFTTVSFRKGKSGDWVNHLDKATAQIIMDGTKEARDKLPSNGYAE